MIFWKIVIIMQFDLRIGSQFDDLNKIKWNERYFILRKGVDITTKVPECIEWTFIHGFSWICYQKYWQEIAFRLFEQLYRYFIPGLNRRKFVHTYSIKSKFTVQKQSSCMKCFILISGWKGNDPWPDLIVTWLCCQNWLRYLCRPQIQDN